MENLNFLPEVCDAEELHQAAIWLGKDLSTIVFVEPNATLTKKERRDRIAKSRYRAGVKNSSYTKADVSVKDAFKPYFTAKEKDELSKAWLNRHNASTGKKAFISGLSREEKDRVAKQWLRQRKDVIGLVPNHKRTRHSILELELRDSNDEAIEP